MNKARLMAFAALVAGAATLQTVHAQVYWENYRGRQLIPVPVVEPAYDNNPAGPDANSVALDNLVVLSADPVNISRSGVLPDMDWNSWSDNLCDQARYANPAASPPVNPTACEHGEMGRVAYALLRFEEVGEYRFQVSNDDFVHIEMDSSVSPFQIANYGNLYRDSGEFDYGLKMAEYQPNSPRDIEPQNLNRISTLTISQPNTHYAVRVYWNNRGSWNRMRLFWKTPSSSDFVPVPPASFRPRLAAAPVPALHTAWLAALGLLAAGLGAIGLRRQA